MQALRTVMLGTALAVPLGCNERREATPTPAVTNPQVTTDKIKEEPYRFAGETVHVAGEIDEVYGPRAFELEGTAWAFNDNIVVLTRSPVALGGLAPMDGDEVMVVGKVRQFVAADVERDLGWDLTPDLEAQLERKPVIVAESIRKVGELAAWSAAPQQAARPATAVVTIVTSVDPATLIGQRVDLGRERVWAVGGKGLWVGPGPMSRIFVAPSDAPSGLQAGDVVQVTGTVQKVPADAAKAWDLPQQMEPLVDRAPGALYIADATVRETERVGVSGSGTEAGGEAATPNAGTR